MNLFKLLIFSVCMLLAVNSIAHCDTMDGPLISDARKAIINNNVNYALKWVPAVKEQEIRDVFNLAMRVRTLSSEAKELADKYFFDTLVRIHRISEGESFTGVKPSGTPIDDKIRAADKSIEIGNLSPLKGMVPKNILSELTERFEKVLSLKSYDVNDLNAGRKYIEAYVRFFRLAEGENDNHTQTTPGANKSH